MRDEDKWPALHAYRTAVANGDAPAIKCPDCGDEMHPVVARSGDPAMRCFSCRAVFEIGLRTWDQIAANIGEVAQNIKEKNDNR